MKRAALAARFIWGRSDSGCGEFVRFLGFAGLPEAFAKWVITLVLFFALPDIILWLPRTMHMG